jgi:hypothetical protein
LDANMTVTFEDWSRNRRELSTSAAAGGAQSRAERRVHHRGDLSRSHRRCHIRASPRPSEVAMQVIDFFESSVHQEPLLPTSLAFSLRKRTRTELEACASNLDDLVATRGNPFVYAVHCAFASHLPLTLSPDDVWLCIAQNFSLHVNLHAEALRDRLVSHRGAKLIQVRRDDFVIGSPDNDWPAVFAEFSQRLVDELNASTELLVANFSTSTAVERDVSRIVLMSAMQPYFKYEVFTLCGIPRITLLGTPADWRAIRLRAESLAQYDLDDWMSVLPPVLDQFVRASDGDVDREFWSSLYKLNGGSGGPYVTGWINTLFPYIKSGSHSSAPGAGELIPNQFMMSWAEPPDAHKCGPTATQFPWGLSRAPFLWQYIAHDVPMEFLGGFVGMSQDPESKSVRPAIGWTVRKTADTSMPQHAARN